MFLHSTVKYKIVLFSEINRLLQFGRPVKCYKWYRDYIGISKNPKLNDAQYYQKVTDLTITNTTCAYHNVTYFISMDLYMNYFAHTKSSRFICSETYKTHKY